MEVFAAPNRSSTFKQMTCFGMKFVVNVIASDEPLVAQSLVFPGAKVNVRLELCISR